MAVQCTEHGRIAEVVLLLTFKRSDSKNAGRKRILPRNISGLISEVSDEVAVQMAKNCRRRHFTPPPRGTPSNIPINPRFPETRIIGLHFRICALGSKNASFLRKSAFLPFKVIQGRPRSKILVPIESAHTTSC